MDEDNISFQKSAPVDPADDSAIDEKPEQVFDISADLNISPIDDSAMKKTAVSGTETKDPQSSFKNSVEQSLDAELNKVDPRLPRTPAAPVAPQKPIAPVIPVPPVPVVPKPQPIPTLMQQKTAEVSQKQAVPPAQPFQSRPIPPIKPEGMPQTPPSMVYSQAGKGGSKENLPEEKIAKLKQEFTALTPTQKQGIYTAQEQQEAPPEPEKAPIPPQNIRTYESDVANVMSHKRTSTASIAMAESAKRDEGQSIGDATESSHAMRNLILTLASLVLVGGGLVGAYYLYSISPLAPSTPVAPKQQIQAAVIPADTQVSVSIDTTDPIELLARVSAEAKKPLEPGTIKEIIPLMTANGKLQRISSADMLKLADISPPDILTRSLNPQWMLGVYANSSGQNRIFVIATENYFQNAFVGISQWENVMADDLKLFLYPVTPHGIANDMGATTTVQALNPLANLNDILPRADIASSSPATTTKSSATTTSATKTVPTKTSTTTPKLNAGKTASTTTATSTLSASSTPQTEQLAEPYFTLRGTFQDRIVKNKDVREFVTSDGTILFLYSFIDNSKLVIAPDEDTLSAIISRLEKQAFVR